MNEIISLEGGTAVVMVNVEFFSYEFKSGPSQHPINLKKKKLNSFFGHFLKKVEILYRHDVRCLISDVKFTFKDLLLLLIIQLLKHSSGT